MNLIRRNPTPLSTFQPGSMEDQFGRMVESMFGEMFGPLARGATWAAEGMAAPRLDVTENEQAFEVQAELPGVKKEDVKVAIDGQRVTIEAECQQANEQRQGEQVVYSERSARKYQRSFTLPSEVDDGNAAARLEDGVLMLTLPKRAGGAARRLTIQ
jgi:HSP20 family protein